MESNQHTRCMSEEALFELLTLSCTMNKHGDIFYQNKEGRHHRIHGPAVICKNGNKFWYKNGSHHREDGPAIITDDTKAWYKNGRPHREDGPAYIRSESIYEEYWVNGKWLDKDQFVQWQKDNGIKPVE